MADSITYRGTVYGYPTIIELARTLAHRNLGLPPMYNHGDLGTPNTLLSIVAW